MDQGIYHDGVSSDPFICELLLSEHRIYIYFKEKERGLLIWDLNSLESCVLSGTTLKIVKDKNQGQRLECSGTIAQTIFYAWSNPVTEKSLGKPKKVISFFLFCLLGILTVGILAYVYLLPWIAGKAVGVVPVDLEIKLGKSLSEVYLKEGDINDSATFYANKFVQQLDLKTDYPIHIYVIQSQEINAFAVPGGNIFIYSGLLEKMGSYEELAALLGHEASHVIKRHSLKSILSSAASGMIITAFFGDVNALSLWAISKADEFKQLDYSRELETEADKEGLKLMVRNQVSPKGMLDLLEVLKKESAEMPAMMKYLSTHPETEERISGVKADPAINQTFAVIEELEKDFKTIKVML